MVRARAAVLAAPRVAHVYTDRLRVRHHELDPFGRVTPATFLRWLAQVAIDASSDAGFDGAWYAAAGAHWLVRRTTFTLHRALGADDRVVLRTWVEDFRRVRSLRRYAVTTGDGAPVCDAATDWVYVEDATGRLRRIPEAITQGLGLVPPTDAAPARADWTAPPAPAAAPRPVYPVRWSDLDALAHVNNAAYLDLCMQGVLDVLGAHGWPVPRLLAEGGMPVVVGGDVEYLDAALPGDRLAAVTWFGPAADGLTAHQRLEREGDGRAIVQANTRWRWPAAAGAAGAPPAALPAALGPLLAA
jgi:acyl-CoA thioester hydrolase